MDLGKHKETVRRVNEECLNAKDVEAADRYLCADVVDHSAPPGLPPGREGVKAWFRQMHAGFPDLTFEVEDLTAEGDRVAWRSTLKGTHQGEFLGIPATGRCVAWTELHLVRFEDGRIAEHWSEGDVLELMRQMGVAGHAAHAAREPPAQAAR